MAPEKKTGGKGKGTLEKTLSHRGTAHSPGRTTGGFLGGKGPQTPVRITVKGVVGDCDARRVKKNVGTGEENRKEEKQKELW